MIRGLSAVCCTVQDGLESKNNRTRVVCADELGTLIDEHGPGLYRPSGAQWLGSCSSGLCSWASAFSHPVSARKLSGNRLFYCGQVQWLHGAQATKGF